MAGAFTVIAGSVILLLDAPSSASAARPETPTSAVLKRAVERKPMPALKAADFDIAKSVRVDVKGKAEPRTSSNIALLPTVNPTATPSIQPESNFSAMVESDAVNLRADASKTSARLAVVSHGTKVAILGTERGWTRIQTEDGRTGWIATKFLRQ